MSDKVLVLSKYASETTYTVYVSKIGSKHKTVIDTGLECGTAQSRCYDEQSDWGDNYTVWMEKEDESS